MFPNFKSLADREQKRLDLLARVQRRVRHNNVKRGMYSVAIWASDTGKTVTVPSSKSLDESAPPMVAIDPLKKSLTIDTVGNNSGLIQPVVEPPVEAKAELPVEPKAEPPLEPKPEPIYDWAYDLAPDPAQVAAHAWVKDWYMKHPDWVSLRIKPIEVKDGEASSRFYIGAEGNIHDIKTRKLMFIGTSLIDWVATEQTIRDVFYDEQSNSIDELGEMRLAEAESAKIPKETNELTADQQNARSFVKGYLIKYPDMQRRIHPILKTGSSDPTSVLVPDGVITDGFLIRSPPVDWVATQEHIMQLQSDDVMDEPTQILHEIDDSEPEDVLPLLLEYVDVVTPERDEAMEQLLQIEAAVPEASDVADELRQSKLETDLAVVEGSSTDLVVRRLRDLHRARIRVDNVMNRLRAERERGTRAERGRLVENARQELNEILRALKENTLMGMEDSDAPYVRPTSTSKRSKHSHRSSEDEKLQESLRNVMKKINAKAFAKRNRAERITVLRGAISILRKLKDLGLPSDVYQTHYLAIHNQLGRLRASTAVERQQRNTEETDTRLMGVPRPSTSNDRTTKPY